MIGLFDPFRHEKIIKRGREVVLDKTTAKETEKEKTLFFTNKEREHLLNYKTYEQKIQNPLFRFAKGKTSYNPESLFNPVMCIGKGKEVEVPNTDYLTKKAKEVFEWIS